MVMGSRARSDRDLFRTCGSGQSDIHAGDAYLGHLGCDRLDREFRNSHQAYVFNTAYDRGPDRQLMFSGSR